MVLIQRFGVSDPESVHLQRNADCASSTVRPEAAGEEPLSTPSRSIRCAARKRISACAVVGRCVCGEPEDGTAPPSSASRTCWVTYELNTSLKASM